MLGAEDRKERLVREAQGVRLSVGGKEVKGGGGRQRRGAEVRTGEKREKRRQRKGKAGKIKRKDKSQVGGGGSEVKGRVQIQGKEGGVRFGTTLLRSLRYCPKDVTGREKGEKRSWGRRREKRSGGRGGPGSGEAASPLPHGS